MADTVPEKIRTVWPPLLLLVAAVGFTVWAQKYGAVPRLLPTIVGSITSVLCLLDLLSRGRGRLGEVLRTSLGADFNNREMTHDPLFRKELEQAAWMVGCIVAMLIFGILPTIPVFIAAYMRVWGARPWRASALSGLAVLAFVVVVFEILLDYRLYRGALFDLVEGLLR